ncbi:MAG: hypothetical protein ACREJ2_16710, partial [Planctomycetota bacterium]
MLSIPLVHHVYSSVGGYKTVYQTQDPAAQRLDKDLVSAANIAYKGGMSATFRGYLRFQLPVPPLPHSARRSFGPWQMPPTVALGNGRWFIKSFPMGTDHVGRPRACVHSIVILPERIHPPPYWQPEALAQMEAALISSYDFPADSLFLHGRDSLQGLRERTHDQIPWQPQRLLDRAAGLEWLAAGNLPPALVGLILRLLLFPGARLFVLASEEHALFLARQLECCLPGGYRRCGGLLLGPQQRYLVPPLFPPNLIQIARPAEYSPGECLLDLTQTPPRWVGPEPPTSPLAGQILDFFNRRDLAGLQRFLQMWDLLDEFPPTPARQTGGLAALTTLKLLTPESFQQPAPDWTRNPAACAAALPLLVQAGWLTAHDAAWHAVRTALARPEINCPDALPEIGVWERYIARVRAQSATFGLPGHTDLPLPQPPAIRAIVKALEAPSHSGILAAMLDNSWIDESSHRIPVGADPLADPTDPTADPTTAPTTAPPAAGAHQALEAAEPASDAFDVDAEFALPPPLTSPSPPLPPSLAGSEPETVQEDWSSAAAAAAAQRRAAEPPRGPAAPAAS